MQILSIATETLENIEIPLDDRIGVSVVAKHVNIKV